MRNSDRCVLAQTPTLFPEYPPLKFDEPLYAGEEEVNPPLELSKVSMSGYLDGELEESSMNGLSENWALYLQKVGFSGFLQSTRTARAVVF